MKVVKVEERGWETLRAKRVREQVRVRVSKGVALVCETGTG